LTFGIFEVPGRRAGSSADDDRAAIQDLLQAARNIPILR
jgi:hypothetical protein